MATKAALHPEPPQRSLRKGLPGVDLVGPLPSEIQHRTIFAAGIVARSKQQDTARALIQFISSSAARGSMKAKGFEAPLAKCALWLSEAEP
jgi:molybdate transport system substrate-binding protein